MQAVDGEEYDVIAFETLPALKEARAIAHLLRTESFRRPAWLSFNCKDDRSLATGESFAEQAVPLALEVILLCRQFRDAEGTQYPHHTGVLLEIDFRADVDLPAVHDHRCQQSLKGSRAALLNHMIT